MSARIAAALLAGSVLACGVPLTVRRVGLEGAPVSALPSERGVRFRIARPAFHVSLLRDETRHDSLVLAQRLDGPALVYEAETRTNPFADTEVGLRLGEGALLQSVSAGETDRSLEIVEAAIQVSKAAAGVVAEPGAIAPRSCDRAQRLAAEIAAYEDAQDVRIHEYERVLTLENECRAQLVTRVPGRCGGLPSDDPRLLARISTLHKEAERRQTEIGAASFDLDAYAEVRIGSRVVKAVSDGCLVVELEEVL